jgi:hypothetical protein
VTTTIKAISLGVFLTALFGASTRAATYTAASCNESDVNAVINGPTHIAVDGDTIAIPPCATGATWASQLAVNVGITLVGAGQGQTVINDSFVGIVLDVNMSSSAETFRLSSMTIQPQAGLSNASGHPLDFTGTCSATTCSSLRLDHLTLTGWTATTSSWLIWVTSAFGVMDNNTVSVNNVNTVIDMFLPSYQGIGSYGDNSWAQADSYGTANAFYIENNTFTNIASTVQALTDCDYYGCRFVVRYNSITNQVPQNHGTESGGRGRGGRQMEVYNNTFFANGISMADAASQRSGAALIFNNTLNHSVGVNFNAVDGMALNRTANYLGIWGTCDGTGAWDQNDGQTTADTGNTVTFYSAPTLTANGSPGWTVNQFAPGSMLYTFIDLSTNNANTPIIISNTANKLTFGGGTFTIKTGDAFVILGTKVYDSGTMTSATPSTTLTDSSKGGVWTANEWGPQTNPGAPYSAHNITRGWGAEFTGNTATGSATFVGSAGYSQTNTWNQNDQYAITRATICIDQDARGQGDSWTGSPLNPPIGFPHDALDPVYEWADTLQSAPAIAIINPKSARYLANRDYYNETTNQAAQTSATTPFNGNTGTGHGTLANRPTTCTPKVAYWATDVNNGNGELYECTATNTWTAFYTPYTYPHPLTVGSGTSPDPPTNVSVASVN